MICMQVSPPIVVALAQFLDDLCRWRFPNLKAAVNLNGVRLPSALDAPPAIPDEALEPELLMVAPIYLYRYARAAEPSWTLPMVGAILMPLLDRRRTPWRGARTQRQRRHGSFRFREKPHDGSDG
jgi:hypothetical protein